MINKRLKKAFEKYIENENKPKTYSYGSGTTYNYNTNKSYTPPTYDCTIFFYEWSNLRSGAKHFKTKNDFFKFLDDSNIKFTDKQKKDIEDIKYANVFATCTPNKPELITANTWYELNNKLTKMVTTNN